MHDCLNIRATFVNGRVNEALKIKLWPSGLLRLSIQVQFDDVVRCHKRRGQSLAWLNGADTGVARMEVTSPRWRACED